MRCPNCDCYIETPQMRWQHGMRARGRCISCAGPTEKISGKEFAKCLSCRRKDAIRRRRKHDIDGQHEKAQLHKEY